jgi:aminopeptidase N
MGDDAFFAALRQHIDANRFGMTTTRRLLAHLQASSDADLAPIFARYLRAY